jgi:hypothetical protein
LSEAKRFWGDEVNRRVGVLAGGTEAVQGDASAPRGEAARARAARAWWVVPAQARSPACSAEVAEPPAPVCGGAWGRSFFRRPSSVRRPVSFRSSSRASLRATIAVAV